VGNLEPYQGIDLLLESAAGTAREAFDLVIIGGDKESLRRYRGRAEELGVPDRVHFAGARPLAQLNSYLRQADFLVSPRVKGVNTPMKIYSYMASGKPLLVTGIVSHTQVLDETCALIVPPEPGAFADGLTRLAGEREYGEGLGSAAARLAAEKYSLEAYRGKVKEICEFLAGT
jgi:glycosyltransferase involved in cell wall biosynthesis